MESLQNILRPKAFSQVIGQPIAVEILQGFIKNQSYKHTRSYIISGNAGTGKTTLARIYANALLCDSEDKPCGNCDSCKNFAKQSHLNYIEIDSASYNKVENMSDILSVAKLHTIDSKPRIIVADEAQRLSLASWDILLKHLEESITNTIFIFVTTQKDKIRDSIQSRSIQIHLRNHSQSEIYEALLRICEERNIEYSNNTLQSISSNANSLRDAIKELDTLLRVKQKAIGYETKSAEGVVLDMLAEIALGNIKDAINHLETINCDLIGDKIAKVLNHLYCPKVEMPIPSIILEAKSQIITPKLPLIAKAFMELKPQTKEQVELFCHILNKEILNDSKIIQQQSTNLATKRVLKRGATQ